MSTLLKLIFIAILGLSGTTVIHSMMGSNADNEDTVVVEWTKEQHESFRKNCHEKIKRDENGSVLNSKIDINKYCDCMAGAMQANDYVPKDLSKASKELYKEVSFCILSTISE